MNDFTRSCRVCEQTFDTVGSTTVFCSDRCRRNNPDLPECKWPNCNRRARRRGFCERDAYRAKVVGDYDSPWLLWGSTAHKAKRKPAKPKPRDVENICRICGDVFMATREAIYCSQTCKDRSKVLREGLTCCECDKPMIFSGLPQGEAMCLSCRRDTSEERRRIRQRRYRREYRARKAMAVSEVYDVYDIIDRDGKDCWICERPVDLSLMWPDQMGQSIDHVIPLVDGGHDVLSNARLSHTRCNATRSNHPDIEEVRSWLRKNPSMTTS